MAMIDVEIDGVRGQMDESLLEKREGVADNENDTAEWVEYWLEGKLVHRSAHVKIKRMPEGMDGIAQKLFGGN